MSIFSFFILIFFTYDLSRAESPAKYAVVIGGLAEEGPNKKHHDFAVPIYTATKGLHNLGYQVKTLFGESNISGPEHSQYANDYKAITSLKPYTTDGSTGAATEKNIREYFNTLLKKIKKGDFAEIFINAHGFNTCGPPIPKGPPPSTCEHVIVISDGNGNQQRFPTLEIVKFIKDLEAKGAYINLNLQACYSGLLKKEIDQLQNSCVFLLSAYNSIGHQCMEGDFESKTKIRDFSSTAHAMDGIYYVNILADLRKDPYLKSKKCFQAITDFQSPRNINRQNYESAYWSARPFDETYHEPYLNSHRNTDFLSSALYSDSLHRREPVCEEDIQLKISSFVPKIESLKEVLLVDAKTNFDKAITAYNTAVSKQKEILAAMAQRRKSDETLNRKLATAQKETISAANEFIRWERLLVSQIYDRNLKAMDLKHKCRQNL